MSYEGFQGGSSTPFGESGIPTREKTNKESATARELNALSKATYGLEGLCAELEKSLNSVLRVVPEDREGDRIPEETLPLVPEEIRRQRRSVESACSILNSIISRLEV